MKKFLYLFPGQGAQYVGIGKDLHSELAVVRETYAEASDALGYDIAKLSFSGEAREINLTKHTQPILLTHSIACLRALQQEHSFDGAQLVAAGHSLGEYSALVSAQVLSFADGLKLVKKRGELMGEYGRGEMEALMLDYQAAAELAARHHCGVASCNLPEQVVVGGTNTDLDALLVDMAEKFPKKRSTRLKTEGAFHTFYMVEAALQFREVLAQTQMHTPQFEVLSNFSGGLHDPDADAIKSKLFMQLFNPVLWYENLTRALDAGAELLIEFGGGLGEGDDPANKRPNLQAMAVKALRGREPKPNYLAVINSQTLKDSAAQIKI